MGYDLSLAELIDRMCIVELKIIHSDTQMVKYSFEEEMKIILEKILELGQDANIIRAIGVLYMSNVSIWDNENGVRETADGKELSDIEKIKLADKLLKTHKLNADRSAAKARIQNITKGRIDAKLNYISGLWNIRY